MNLYLVKPDLTYYEQYNDMMTEWCADGGSVSPWFLGEPFTSIDEFVRFVRMLRMMLEQAKTRNICKVLLAAYENNIGSWKTIEKCGGVLENIVFEEGDDREIRRYWINL